MPPIYQDPTVYIPAPGSEKPREMRGIVDPDSEDWFLLGPAQVFVPLNSLTARGVREYDEACRRAREEEPTKVIVDGFLLPISSGMWAPDPRSPYYNNDFMHLNHMTDRELSGKVEGANYYLTTSKVKWHGQNEDGVKWVITRSGSLYYYKSPVFED